MGPFSNLWAEDPCHLADLVSPALCKFLWFSIKKINENLVSAHFNQGFVMQKVGQDLFVIQKGDSKKGRAIIFSEGLIRGLDFFF